MVCAPVQSYLSANASDQNRAEKTTDHVHGDKDPRSPVLEHHLASGPFTFVLGGTLSVTDTVVSQALGGKNSLFLGKPLGGGRVVREDHPGKETDKAGSNTFEEEQPTPTGKTSSTVHVASDETSEETGKGTGNGGGGVVNRESGSKFTLLVPGREVECHTRRL